MLSLLRAAVCVFLSLSLITGVAYPLAITGLARACFPSRATGSIIFHDGRAIGSELVGQDFSGDPRFFWSRPSATSPAPYTAFNPETLTGSGGSNLGPTNPALLDRIRARIAALREADASVGYDRPADQLIPVDLVTASASGLDPHLSPAAAEYQAPRVAQARGLDLETVRSLIRTHTTGRDLGVLGEPVVHVLRLNLALDAARP